MLIYLIYIKDKRISSLHVCLALKIFHHYTLIYLFHCIALKRKWERLKGNLVIYTFTWTLYISSSSEYSYFCLMSLYIKGLFVIRLNYRKYVEFDRIYILIDNLKNVLNLNLINSTKFLNKLWLSNFKLKRGLCPPP